MEMKMLLAIILLACVSTIHGELGARRKDLCTQGMVAMEVFFEYRGCGRPKPHHAVRRLIDSLPDDVTVDSLHRVFHSYCSTIMPRMVQCFEGNLGNCSAQQQASLRAVAQNTGFICQPNSSRVHPVVIHVLRQLSNDDLGRNPRCRAIPIEHIQEQCANRSFEAIGMANQNISILEQLTMEQMVPKVQTFFSTMVECTVTGVRDSPDRCPEWRGMALFSLRFILYPTLGLGMTFTTDDMDRMFGWTNTSQHPMY